ncbi:MAG: Eco57I restriction-modification methylase domain-containing protein [Verrucomicrobiales bacterium]|nr:Eco57I restriction-modification methylase domain-containing protein [Verrucomicrobiales bacterium]
MKRPTTLSSHMTGSAAIDRRDRQGQLGQFLTAPRVADFMASMFGDLPKSVRLLDAGAGAGALTLAFVSRCCDPALGVRSIEATLYEVDSGMIESLRSTLRECAHRCGEAGIEFAFTIRIGDFIREMAESLSGDLFGTTAPTFNIAIANPPYRKIASDSHERAALRSVGIETSNLYTGFVALMLRLLEPGGQLVAITPRSFCNGPYFRPFREDFLSRVELRRLHVFESRKAAFREDAVLQENVIFHAVRGRQQSSQVIVTTSSGSPGAEVLEQVISFADVVRRGDTQRFIHIPSSASHATAKDTLGNLTASLASLGISVSTGPVVDFRLKQALRKAWEPGAVPLVYPCHFNGGLIHWPKHDARKPNAIVVNPETRPWLIPSGMYVLTKRFTSKEERRRLVACVFDPKHFDAELIGLENHLNYFHAGGRGLERLLALGLFVFLNSTVVDQYFRRFSGHTQVNATDLRTLSYPDIDTLRAMGRGIDRLDLRQGEIDEIVEDHLHAKR